MGLVPFSGQIHADSLWVNVASVANVASTNTQSPMRRAIADKLGIGNIDIGNIFTLATFHRLT